MRVDHKFEIRHRPMDIVIELAAAEQRLILVPAEATFEPIAKIRPGR